MSSVQGVAAGVLARRAGLGDKAAFASLVDRHGPALYRYALRILQDRSHADDCLQDTLTAAWTGLPAFRGEASVKTWLFTIVRRQTYAVLRQRQVSRERRGGDEAAAELVADPMVDPASDSIGTSMREALDRALGRLPERQRSVWMLRELDGFSYEQIGAIVGTTTPAVRGLLERARGSLAREMADWR